MHPGSISRSKNKEKEENGGMIDSSLLTHVINYQIFDCFEGLVLKKTTTLIIFTKVDFVVFYISIRI